MRLTYSIARLGNEFLREWDRNCQPRSDGSFGGFSLGIVAVAIARD